jgi:AraC family transcriptional regulator
MRSAQGLFGRSFQLEVRSEIGEGTTVTMRILFRRTIDRPEMTNWNLGASEVQASHQRNIGSDEIRIGGLAQHLIILFTKPPREMNVRCEGVKRNAPPPAGSMALVPVGAVAEVSWRGNKDCLQLSVEPNLVQRVAAKSFERDLSSGAIPPLDAFIAPELRSAVPAIGAELGAGALGGSLMIESLANILAIHLIRHLFGFRRAAASLRGVLSRRKLDLVIDYIMANLDNRPTLERMAELVHFSPDHFARQFKAATGLAPYQFVIARRVERAQEFLCGRQVYSLAEVAIAAGFSDQSQLCLHFKRIAGVTPRHYRASRIA